MMTVPFHSSSTSSSKSIYEKKEISRQLSANFFFRIPAVPAACSRQFRPQKQRHGRHNGDGQYDLLVRYRAPSFDIRSRSKAAMDSMDRIQNASDPKTSMQTSE